MRAFRFSIWVVLAVVAAGVGCRTERAPAVKKAIPRVALTEITWGPAAEGLQCRLKPVKRSLADGEAPAFTVDLRNQGGRVFTFLPSSQAPLHQFAVDGCWYPWPHRSPTDGKTQAFGPGVEIANMPVTLPADNPSLVAPGWHTIQVAFSFEGVEVVSNRVEIERVASR